MAEGIAKRSKRREKDVETTRTAGEPRQYSEWREVWRRLRRNRPAMVSLTLAFIIVLVAVFADQLSPYNHLAIDLRSSLEGPSWDHWLGTDVQGRDVLSRLMHGARVSLTVGFGSVAIAMGLGVLIGLSSGYRGGASDTFIMRIMDVIFAFPAIFLAIVVMAYFGQGMLNVLLVIGIIFTPGIARIVRASVLVEKERDYVAAARSIGVPGTRIMFSHILPNVLAPVIVISTLQIATAILIESSLSFIGLGTVPPDPTWGNMLAAGRTYIRTDPLLCILPGLCIMITVLSFNLLGDGLRDAMDPRLRT